MYRPSGGGGDLTAITPKTEFTTVIGVVHDLKLAALADRMDAPAAGPLYPSRARGRLQRADPARDNALE